MARHILKTNREIIFVPDKYLARYVSDQLNHKFIVWDGFCPTHARISPEDINEAKTLHPRAKVIAHPECRPEVTRLADAVLSTEKMCAYATESPANEFIIGTEIGIIHRMKKENPKKIFYPVSESTICPNMKKINLEKVLWSLEDLSYQINIEPDIMDKARLSIERMLKIT
jgi:quinolinate synthase